MPRVVRSPELTVRGMTIYLLNTVHYSAHMVKPSTAAAPSVDTSDVPIDHAKIRRLREELGLSQTELARRAQLSSAGRVSKIENGVVLNITVDTLDHIAAALGVKAKDLLK